MNTTISAPRPSAGVARAAVLDTWASHPWQDGVRVDRLCALDRITIRTLHSIYDIVVVSPRNAEILVRGGAFFPVFTPARVAGSSLGGSFLKLHGAYVGFRLELVADGRSIVTSTVRTIAVNATSDGRVM